MGQTPKALRCKIWVDEDYLADPQIQALVEKGHMVVGLAPKDDAPQLILSRAAHQWTPEMAKIKGLLETVMQATRKRKREA